MIAAEHVVKKFNKLRALDDVSFTFLKGQTISLVGPNGSGKTTLIKSLLGLVVPESGNILVDGENIKGSSMYRNKIGYMPQTGRFPENITVEQLFNMVRDIRKSHGTLEDRDLMDTFGIDEIRKKTTRTLSGGTRQKVSACLSFLFDPPIIILDEPTAGLDPLSSEQLKEKILKEKDKGKLILITSHVLSDLDDITSEVVFLQEGSIMFHKPIAQLKADTGEDKLTRAIAVVMKSGLHKSKQ